MKMGFGRDYSVWDKLVEDAIGQKVQALNEKLKTGYKYQNYYPFKSPKGKWFCFYGDTYADIRIYDLETLELVTKSFYSNMEKKVYAHHANYSSYVPGYYTSKYKDEYLFAHEEYTLGDEKDNLPTVDELQYSTFAFNAWTIWAADTEFYVDIIDLSDIDNGNVKLIDKEVYIISRDTYSMRDMVNIDVENCNSSKIDDPPDIYITYEILTKTWGVMHQNKIPNYEKTNEDGEYGCYKNKDMLPWQELEIRLAEFKKENSNG